MEMVVFQLIILLFSVVIHEVSHGFVAERLGDPTARLAGRLTLNPLKHLDPFGSVILPLLLSLLPSGIIFGWAKPVPYNPANLKDPERGGAIIAIAGPASNLFLAFVFSILYRLVEVFSYSVPWLNSLTSPFGLIVLVNVMLAVFNLVPIPPLDGSKILFAVLPQSANRFRAFLETYGMFLVLIFIFFGFGLIVPIIFWLYRLFIGG